MSPRIIKIIDKYIGVPICVGLTAIYYVLDFRKPAAPKKILFIKLIEQGATVLAYSAIDAARQAVGKENVYFICFKNNRPIVDATGFILPENVLTVRDNNLVHFIGDMLWSMWKLRRLGVDTTIDMEFFSRASAIYGYLSGARNRAGLHKYTSELPYRGNLMTTKIQHNPYLHTAKSYLQITLAALGQETGTPAWKKSSTDLDAIVPVLKFGPNRITNLKQKLIEIGVDINKRLVLLNPNASDMLPLRKWETNNFEELGKRILDRYDEVQLIFTGASEEVETAEHLVKLFPKEKAASVAGKTSLQELIELFSLSALLVTNDSGPGHFSSLADLPTVVLFGPETPDLFGPLGQHSTVIWKQLACSPCVNAYNHRFSPCSNNICMQSITVDEVFEACCQKLGR